MLSPSAPGLVGDSGLYWGPVRRDAMTLVEVMIAVTILAFALLPLFLFLRTGTRGVQGTRDIATATFLATQALERARAWDYPRLADEDLAGGDPGPSFEASLNAPDEAEITVGPTAFSRIVEVTPLGPAGATPPVKVVKVRVEWQRKDLPLHYEVTTVLHHDE